MKKLNALTLGYAGAAVAALGMLIMWILGNMGLYQEAVTDMENWHAFFSLSFGGLIGGAIEAALITFVTLFVFGWFYNAFAAQK